MKVLKTAKDLLEFIEYDTVNEVYKMSYEGAEGYYYMDILMINSKDLISLSPADVEFDCLKFAKLYKIYQDDIKIVALNFPCSTIKQQQYFKEKIRRASNEVFKVWLERKLEEMVLLEKNSTTREFYLLTFSKTLEEHSKNKTTLLATLSSGRDGLISKIPSSKKHQIVYKLHNKNMVI